jgi:DNA repair exonuclease SbcCD nuclease subunit
MPYPTPTRYLKDEEAQRYASLEEKNRHVQAAYARTLAAFQQHANFNPALPTVLSAHVHVQGARLPGLFRISEEESIVFAESDLPAHLAYVALGHIHQPQCLMGLPHVRYSGSIERLDLGESRDDKGVVVFEVGPEGRRDEPRVLPLEATPVYHVEMQTPLKDALAELRERYPDAQRDLVHVEFTYTAGVDDLEGALRELEDIFPRWYYRHWSEVNELGPALTVGEPNRSKSFEDTVRDYLKQELMNHSEDEREALLARVEALMKADG